MSAPVDLTPLGTARARVGEPAAGLAFPESLRAAVREYDLPAETVALAWEIARLARNIEPAEGEALLFLALATLVAARQGSTRVPLSGAPEEAGETPYLDSIGERLGLSPKQRAAATALLATARVPGENPVAGVLDGNYARHLDGPFLYQQRMLFYEDRLAALGARLRARPLPTPRPNADAALADLLARPPAFSGAAVELSQEQQSAIRAALTSALTVVSGGPGTGKTSIVFSILRALVRLGVPVESIALAAPTGGCQAARGVDRQELPRSRGAMFGRGPPPGLLSGNAHRLRLLVPERRFRHHEKRTRPPESWSLWTNAHDRPS
jgi:exodeoxyribonuclease V alpha subunit